MIRYKRGYSLRLVSSLLLLRQVIIAVADISVEIMYKLSVLIIDKIRLQLRTKSWIVSVVSSEFYFEMPSHRSHHIRELVNNRLGDDWYVVKNYHI